MLAREPVQGMQWKLQEKPDRDACDPQDSFNPDPGSGNNREAQSSPLQTYGSRSEKTPKSPRKVPLPFRDQEHDRLVIAPETQLIGDLVEPFPGGAEDLDRCTGIPGGERRIGFFCS